MNRHRREYPGAWSRVSGEKNPPKKVGTHGSCCQLCVVADLSGPERDTLAQGCLTSASLSCHSPSSVSAHCKACRLAREAAPGPHPRLCEPFWTPAVEQAAGALDALQLRESVSPQSSSRLSFSQGAVPHMEAPPLRVSRLDHLAHPGRRLEGFFEDMTSLRPEAFQE